MKLLQLLLIFIIFVEIFTAQNDASFSKSIDNSDKEKTSIINLDHYPAQGYIETLDNGYKANVFLGLPYAKPPIENLRFEKPQSLDESNKVIKAFNYGPPCHPQENHYPFIKSSEDCLTLNILTPLNIKNKKYPVLVFIHGGGYNYGFSEAFHHLPFISNLVTKDIIVITLNYRLTHFGFLTLKDGGISPNLGLWDQNLALKFIKNNIEKFGGDSNHITISGHSAGSASVQSHLLSPHSRDLFNAAIQMGGSLTAYWAADDDVYDYSEMVIKELNCKKDSGIEIKKCLQQVPYQEFWEVKKKLGFKEMTPGLDLLYWNPTMDKDFFDGKTWKELTKETKPKPMYYGVDGAEGLIFTMNSGHPITSPYACRQGVLSEHRKYFTKNQFRSHLVNVMLDPRIKNRDIIADEILDFYNVKDEIDEVTSLYNFQRFTEYVSIFGVLNPIMDEYKENLKNGYTDQYLYIFNYTRPSERSILGDEPPHGYEFLFLVDLNVYTADNTPFNDVDYKIKKVLVDSMANFVKTYDPSIDDIKVPKLTENKINYLHISDDDFGIKHGYYEKQYKFWKNLGEKYGISYITGRLLSKTEGRRQKDEF